LGDFLRRCRGAFGLGMVWGAAFGVLLSLTESRKGILKLSLPRAALWGVLGSAALPLLTTMNDSILVFACPLGAALAATTVALARRAELRAGPQQSQLP